MAIYSYNENIPFVGAATPAFGCIPVSLSLKLECSEHQIQNDILQYLAKILNFLKIFLLEFPNTISTFLTQLYSLP